MKSGMQKKSLRTMNKLQGHYKRMKSEKESAHTAEIRKLAEVHYQSPFLHKLANGLWFEKLIPGSNTCQGRVNDKGNCIEDKVKYLIAHFEMIAGSQ